MLSFLKRVFRKISRIVLLAIGPLLPINKSKIILSSYCGNDYSDNPKYIANELLRRNTNVEIIWAIREEIRPTFIPEGVKPCIIGTPEYVFHLLTSKVWIDNCRKEFVYKRKNQTYIQTWHGFAIKRIESDVADKLGSAYVNRAIRDSKAIDLIISEGSYMTNIYKNSFWYSGEVAEWGSPRYDVILDPNFDKKSIRARLSIPDDTKIILYAPTFRANKSLEPYAIDTKRVIEACEARFGGKFIFMTRLHPNLTRADISLDFGDAIDASTYPDIQELLAISDVVISDYSSLIVDFALTKRPCFQFATDYPEYRKDRDLYFELNELPFAFTQSNDELVSAIEHFDSAEHTKKINAFLESVGMVLDGDSSKKCVDFILEKMGITEKE